MSTENVVRTHDKLYLKEDRKNEPKEYFKFINSIVKEQVSRKDIKVVDVGCATGDFVYYLKQQYPNIDITGIDVDDELLARARKEVPQANFVQGDISAGGDFGKYDLVFMNGVHSIFENLDWLGNLLKMRRNEKSCIYVFGLFNPENLDVIIKARPSGSTCKWETGWNVFSMQTVSSYLTENKLKSEYRKFEIGLDITKDLNDPFRSWTEPIGNGKRMIISGLQLRHTFYLLEITSV